jgi:hypothetical protein
MIALKLLRIALSAGSCEKDILFPPVDELLPVKGSLANEEECANFSPLRQGTPQVTENDRYD